MTSRNSIYDRHAAAFKGVSAWTISKAGQRIASIAFKHGASVTCYLHVFGTQMVKGRACGGGYDRMSAAAYEAACKLESANSEHYGTIMQALKEGNGAGRWDSELIRAGFDVWQAV